MSMQNVFIIGATGAVGSELLQQVVTLDSPHLRRHRNPTRIVGIANSTHGLFCQDGLKDGDILASIESSPGGVLSYLKSHQDVVEHGGDLTKLIGLMDGSGIENDVIFIDVTNGGKALEAFHLAVITQTPNRIVTANKNPIALSNFEAYRDITRHRERYGLRSTFMAGAHAVTELINLYDLSEKVNNVSGCLSGSLNYMCYQAEQHLDKPISSILQEANEYGYTEPDPRDDLSGLDVARKLVIAGRSLGLNIGIDDIDVKPFVSFSETDPVIDATADVEFAQRLQRALQQSKVLRYVAEIDLTNQPKLCVGLQEVDKSSPLGALQGTANILCIDSKIYSGEGQYIVQAPGAGLAVTAAGIRRDLLDMLNGRETGSY